MVDLLASFSVIAGARVNEDGSVTAIHHAIVEKDAESGCGRGGIRDLFRCHDFLHDSVEIRAGFRVVVEGKVAVRLRDGDGGEHQEEK